MGCVVVCLTEWVIVCAIGGGGGGSGGSIGVTLGPNMSLLLPSASVQLKVLWSLKVARAGAGVEAERWSRWLALVAAAAAAASAVDDDVAAAVGVVADLAIVAIDAVPVSDLSPTSTTGSSCTPGIPSRASCCC